MERRQRGEGLVRLPAGPDGPVAEVVIGGEADGPDVGIIRLEVPAGAGAPAHTHGGSDIVLLPVEGSVRITSGDESVTIGVGDALLIEKHEEVSLVNPGDRSAHVIVAAGPANFVAHVRRAPSPDTGEQPAVDTAKRTVA